MRKSFKDPKKGTQLNFLSIFDTCDLKCDVLLNKLIDEAKNTRYLITRIRFSELKPKVAKYWTSELEDLLDYYCQLCESIKSQSFKYFHYSTEDFASLWKFNEDVYSSESVSVDDIVSHYKASTNRLKAAILSESQCLRNSGPVIDLIKEKLLLNSRLLQSFYL